MKMLFKHEPEKLLKQEIIAQINDKNGLLESGKNRLAKVKTGNLKKYIQAESPLNSDSRSHQHN